MEVATKSGDIASVFRHAADARKEEQANTENAIKAGTALPVRRGRKPVYTGEDPKVTVTYTLTESRRKKLRTYAFQHETTISKVISEFIDGLQIDG